MAKSMKVVEVLRQFFGKDRQLTVAELKPLSRDERLELAKLAAAEIGVDLELPA
jgi:hypothetical protein